MENLFEVFTLFIDMDVVDGYDYGVVTATGNTFPLKNL